MRRSSPRTVLVATLAAFVLLVVILLFRGCGPRIVPRPVSQLERWGYLVSGTLVLPRDAAYLERVVPGLAVLSPTGPLLDRGGRLVGRDVDPGIAALARRHRVPVLPLVAFSSAADGHTLLATDQAVERAVRTLARYCKDGGHAGVHLDFEQLPPEDAPRFAAFLKRLRPHLAGRRVTIALFPPVGLPRAVAGAHDLDLLAPYIDEAVLMAYDLNRPGTAPGPVTDLAWAEKNLRRVLRELPARKVWLGVPAYGYRWISSGKTEAVPAAAAQELARLWKGVRHQSGTLYIHYADRAGVHEIYVADRETRGRLDALAARCGVRGVAAWRMGFED